MKRFYMLFLAFAIIGLCSCIEIANLSDEQKALIAMYTPQCHQETIIAVEDDEGEFFVPGCVDYEMSDELQELIEIKMPEIKAAESQEPQKRKAVVSNENKRVVREVVKTAKKPVYKIKPEEVEGEYPTVEVNKYINQVILENLNTHVLAYCRGTEEEIEICVSRLENSCYVRLPEIPKFAAQYDYLKNGTYPTRRWRNGEYFPRW